MRYPKKYEDISERSKIRIKTDFNLKSYKNSNLISSFSSLLYFNSNSDLNI